MKNQYAHCPSSWKQGHLALKTLLWCISHSSLTVKLSQSQAEPKASVKFGARVWEVSSETWGVWVIFFLSCTKAAVLRVHTGLLEKADLEKQPKETGRRQRAQGSKAPVVQGAEGSSAQLPPARGQPQPPWARRGALRVGRALPGTGGGRNSTPGPKDCLHTEICNKPWGKRANSPWGWEWNFCPRSPPRKGFGVGSWSSLCCPAWAVCSRRLCFCSLFFFLSLPKFLFNILAWWH